MKNYISPVGLQSILSQRAADEYREREHGIKPQTRSAHEQRVLDEFDDELRKAMSQMINRGNR